MAHSVNKCDCVAVFYFIFLTNASLGLLLTDIASTIHLHAMWVWLKAEGAHVPSTPTPPYSDIYVDVSHTQKMHLR